MDTSSITCTATESFHEWQEDELLESLILLLTNPRSQSVSAGEAICLVNQIVGELLIRNHLQPNEVSRLQ
jgi:hypothetical protein